MNLAYKLQCSLIMSPFIFSSFGYHPLVWIFHGRQLNNCINNIHERALRIVFRDYESTFQQLLKQNRYTCIHQGNLQILAIKIFNVSPSVDCQTIFKCKCKCEYKPLFISMYSCSIYCLYCLTRSAMSNLNQIN